jgi:hypothetical protein
MMVRISTERQVRPYGTSAKVEAMMTLMKVDKVGALKQSKGDEGIEVEIFVQQARVRHRMRMTHNESSTFLSFIAPSTSSGILFIAGIAEPSATNHF